jgi:multiple sugar transport system substrate-binding protein
VGLVGFDDLGPTRAMTSPLTTVRYSFETLGRRAIELLLARLAGKAVIDQVVVPLKVVVRQSCGCIDASVTRAAVPPQTIGKASSSTPELMEVQILASMKQALAVATGSIDVLTDSVAQVLRAFRNDLEENSSGCFLNSLQEALNQTIAEGQDVEAWQDVISVLRSQIAGIFSEERMRLHAENLCQQARMLIGQTARRVQESKRLHMAEQEQRLRDIGSRLLTTFEMERLMSILAEELPGLGIPACFLTMYDAPQPYTYPQSISEWQARGLIYPLDEFVNDGTFDFSNVAQANLDGGVIDGQLWAINLGTNSLGIAVDTDAFAAAGMDLPADDWTWDDFETICQEYTEKTGKWCINQNITDSQTVKSLYLGYDQWMYSDDGKSLGYDDDQPFIDLMNRFLWLQDGGMMMPREEAVALGDQGVEVNELVTDEAAMGYFWSNQLVAVQSAAGEDRNFRFIHLPRPADGCCSSNYVKPSMFFSVTADSQNPKEAAAFINWWTNSKEANEILFAERGVPVSTEVQDHLKPMLDKAQLEMFEAMARIAADASPIRPPDPPGHADIRNNVYDPELRDPVLYGLISAEEGVAVFREMASEILASQE